MLTTFGASSTPVMRMLMTMLLMLMTDSHSSCNATQSLTYIELRHNGIAQGSANDDSAIWRLVVQS